MKKNIVLSMFLLISSVSIMADARCMFPMITGNGYSDIPPITIRGNLMEVESIYNVESDDEPCLTLALYTQEEITYYLHWGDMNSDWQERLDTILTPIYATITGVVYAGGPDGYVINVNKISLGDEPQYDFADRWVALDISDGMESELIQISEHVYTIEKDTAIGDNTYKTLWRDGKQYIGALRTEAEGQKVYFNPNGKEYLLMDFSVQVGDTVNAWWGDYNAETECQPNWTMEHSDTIMPEWKVIDVSYVDGRKHVKVARIHKYSLGVSNEWIEGIGTVHILFPYGSSVCKEGINISFWTLCAYQDNRQLYSFDLSRYGIVNDCPDWHQIGNCLPDVHSTNSAAQKQLKDNRLVITLPDGRHFDQLGRLIKE